MNPKISLKILNLLDYLVDSRVGIVQNVSEKPRESGAPDFFHYYATACNTGAFVKQENFSHTGGASNIREVALAKAIGEAIERYCSAIYEYKEFPFESYESAPFHCVLPNKFALFSPKQYEELKFPYVPFRNNTLIHWTSAFDPLTKKELYIPAAMIYVPYFFRRELLEPPITQPISTGLACHDSFNEAAISGICEVIERDAVAISWQAKLNPPQIMLETLDNHNYDLVNRFQQVGNRIIMLNITTDIGIPTILSVSFSSDIKSPALAFAASTSMNPKEAARKSLEELAHTRRYCQLIKTYMPPIESNLPKHEIIYDQVTHLGFWANHRNASFANFLFSSKKRISFNEIKNLSVGDSKKDLLHLCSLIRDFNYQVLIKDITTNDIKHLGLSVIRAIIPGFHPLHMGYSYRALGGKRLWNVPRNLGYKAILPETGDNPFPHPYP